MKIQADRGAGGHNGIKSIIGSLGTQAFARVRVGVDKPPKREGTTQGADWVLSRFKKGEAAAVADAIERAADAVELMVKKGVEAAATEFNRSSTET
jgi:PTH1 family peptidyl-tRNA hydrolase